ncbi:MAG: hypothetical protein MUD00_03170 [Candidatus Pacebacteria bacterium]|jgi:hypothetical protein|nr:hypothetical protein [Candidatus Paceibacterota bacterium]
MAKKLTIWIIILVLIGGGIYALVRYSQAPGPLDGFATCVKDSGAQFYGAFWCPHCQTQKKSFGKSQKLLPYIECSTPDGRGQTNICKEKGIASYPTWTFADGTTLNGEVPLTVLAEKTSCALPQ